MARTRPARSLVVPLVAACAVAGAWLAPAPSRAQPAPAASAPASASAGEEPEPPLPSVDDVLLEALPPAEPSLATWQEVVALVRERGPELAIALSQSEAAEAQARITRARMLPTLTAQGGVTRHLLTGEGVRGFGATGVEVGTIPDPLTTWSASLSLRVPVLALQAWYDVETARRSARATRLKAADAERLAIITAASAVVNVVTAERLAEVSRVALRSALINQALQEKRAAAGVGTAVDRLRTRQEVAAARGQVVKADGAVLAAREQLGRAVGAEDLVGVSPGIRLDTLMDDARATCPAGTDLRSRADVRAAEAQVAIAQRQVAGADLAHAPTVDATSTLTYHPNTDSSPNQEHATWTVGAVLTWTLYDGGARYGQKALRRSEVRTAELQARETRRRARLEIQQADRAVRTAEATLGVTREARDLAVEAERVARRSFALGRGTSFDLVEASRSLRQAELDLTVKEFEVVEAKLAAYLARASCGR